MSLTTGRIAELTGGALRGSPDVPIEAVALLAEAGQGDLAFIGDAAHAKHWPDSRAAAALVDRKLDPLDPPAPDARAIILVDDVDLALALVLEALAPPPVLPPVGVHPSAVIDPAASLGDGCRIGPLCVVGARAQVGDGCVFHDRVTVMADARIGRGVTMFSGAVVRERCAVGDGSILHAGAVVGADGFGYRPAPDGRGLVKIPQIGDVRIGRDVEIGANACVDRAKFGSTIVGDGCKIDNLVQIGHNCRLGRCVVIAGLSGLAGSITVGDGVMIGGAADLKDHITIGPGAKIAGGAQVMNDVPAGETWAGSPAQEYRRAAREYAAVRQLPEALKQVRKHLKSLTD